MGRLGVSFRSWEGKSDDDQIPSPEQRQLPWVRFTPRGGRIERSATGVVAIPLTVHAEVITDSYCSDDWWNFYEQLERLVTDEAFQSSMQGYGVTEIVPTLAECGATHLRRGEPSLPGSIAGIAEFELKIYREV